MSDNFDVSWPVSWSKFARKQIFIPKRLDSMFSRALVPGWRPFVNKVYTVSAYRNNNMNTKTEQRSPKQQRKNKSKLNPPDTQHQLLCI